MQGGGLEASAKQGVGGLDWHVLPGTSRWPNKARFSVPAGLREHSLAKREWQPWWTSSLPVLLRQLLCAATAQTAAVCFNSSYYSISGRRAPARADHQGLLDLHFGLSWLQAVCQCLQAHQPLRKGINLCCLLLCHSAPGQRCTRLCLHLCPEGLLIMWSCWQTLLLTRISL